MPYSTDNLSTSVCMFNLLTLFEFVFAFVLLCEPAGLIFIKSGCKLLLITFCPISDFSCYFFHLVFSLGFFNFNLSIIIIIIILIKGFSLIVFFDGVEKR